MKVLNNLKLRTLVLMLIIGSTLMLGSCKEDDNNSTGADKTALTELIKEADKLSADATDSDYPQTAIDTYKSTLQTIKGKAATNLTQVQVKDLVDELKEAMDTFKSKGYGYVDETTHLIAGWHFDEGMGTTTTDYSSIKHVATFQAGNTTVFAENALSPTWVDGVNGGKAVHLNNGAHLEVPYVSTFLPNDLSISVWIKPMELYQNNYILSQNYWNGYQLKTQGMGKVIFTYKKENGDTISADTENSNLIIPGQWNHIVVTLNGAANELTIYVNGILSDTWDAATKNIGPLVKTLTSPGPQPFLIGAVATEAEIGTWNQVPTPTTMGYFKGDIDELKLFNIALEEAQVSKLYSDEKP